MVLPENHYDVLTSKDWLARCYVAQGKMEDAFPILRETLQIRTEELGPTHQATLNSMSSLASGHRKAGQLEEALVLFEKVVELRKIRLGEQHELTYSSIANLGAVHFSLKNIDEAKALSEQSYEGLKNELNNDHPKALMNMQNLAAIYYLEKDYDRAIKLMKENIELTQEKLSFSHPDSVSGMRHLAVTLFNLGRYDDAIEQYKQVVSALETGKGENHLETIEAKAALGDSYRWAFEFDLAIETLEPVFDSGKRVADFDYYRRALRMAYARDNRIEKFQEMADEDLISYRKTLEPGSMKLRSRIATLGLDYVYAKEYEMADTLLAEAVEILEGLELNNHTLPNNQSIWGEALMGLGRFDEAGPLLIAGYEGLKQHEESIHALARPDNMVDSADRLLRYYQHIKDEENIELISGELQQLRVKYDRQ